MNVRKTPSPGFAARGGHRDTHQPILAQSPVNLILARLERVRQTSPTTWMASCPCEGHRRGDKTRSLSVRENEKGDVLLRCFTFPDAHGAAEVAAAFGLELSELFAAAAARGESGRPRVPRIPWPDVFEALEMDLLVMSFAFRDLAAGKAFSGEDAQAISARALELARVISGVRSGRT